MNKILSILVVICIAALLAVPIFAKQDKGKQATVDVVESGDQPQILSQSVEKGRWKQDFDATTDFVVESSGKMVKEMKKVKDQSSEKLRHNINVGSLFTQTEAVGAAVEQAGIKFSKVGGKMKAALPEGWETKNQAHIKLKDISGEEIADLITEFDLTDSELNRVEKGSASLRSIKSMRLVSKEKDVVINDLKGKAHKIKAHVNVGLNAINEGSSLDITTNNDLESDVDTKFTELAKKYKLKLNNRGGVMKVDKIDLRNGEEVENATVTFKVEPEWVGEDNINNIQILRYDEGYSEVLPTEFAGVDEDGLLVFEGQSSNGLSTFAIFMTENITDTQETSFDWSKMKAVILPLLLIVTVGAAFVGSVIRKEHK